ncbi:SCO2524 family protein [Nocardia yamanashiensis]|uniref:SCO2524 family protein n=1 Tax=Nocardia yamanashiensis TaxID=209247 RepID=UPI001E5661A7|nr:SCO2524 family protein [Nocardia yamanashiensis]UGT40573.1 SCO2524 family protein [Nocardia yamanashiensis]
MRIQPRQQILGIWRSLLNACYLDGAWTWGGRDGSNSISDAEQLLCLLYPATVIDGFGLHQPDEIADDIKVVLAPMGAGARIGANLVGVLEQYIERYTRVEKLDGEPETREVPVFSAGSYLSAMGADGPTERQLDLDVVDSYSMSLTLCLAALKFLRGFQPFVLSQARPEARALAKRIDVLDKRINDRLTAAMVGLVRSFVVNTVRPEDPDGQAMLTMLNQTGASSETVVESVARRLERVRIRLRNDLTLSQTPGVDLYDEELLFECGWSWSLVREAAAIDFVDMPIAAEPGYAVARPYLHFTVVALDGINDLTSVRTRELDLLDAQQRRLAEALQLRWDLAQRYWAAVARFGTGRWPLEDIPWRTSDGEESDYFSLIVSAVLMQDLLNREASDDDLTRAAPIFDELARRGRIIRRLTEDDPARHLHTPGVSLRLHGSGDANGGGPLLTWTVSDYATVLLKRTLQAARLSGTMETRDRLMALAQATMDHLDRRAFREGRVTGLWDDPARIFGGEENDSPSWYLTERVVECLVTAAQMYEDPPLRPPGLVVRAMELLTEAEHLLNHELLELSEKDASPHRVALTRAERRLQRARRIIDERPGTALSLASEALLELDELDFARLDATRSM